jgi:hypothetical protein
MHLSRMSIVLALVVAAFVDDDPTNGKGFESAVAYAVAKELGFAKGDGQVDGRSIQRLICSGSEGLRL